MTHVNKLLILVFLLLANSAKSQTITNFARGYKSGFVEGYCYGNQSVA